MMHVIFVAVAIFNNLLKNDFVLLFFNEFVTLQFPLFFYLHFFLICVVKVTAN